LDWQAELPDTKIILVYGEMLVGSGSRLQWVTRYCRHNRAHPIVFCNLEPQCLPHDNELARPEPTTIAQETMFPVQDTWRITFKHTGRELKARSVKDMRHFCS